jgi:hypothetical protein
MIDTRAPEQADIALQVVHHLQELDRLRRSHAGQLGLDPALQRELCYCITSFRQRFPDVWNTAPADPAQGSLL